MRSTRSEWGPRWPEQGARVPKLMHKTIPFHLLRNSIFDVCVHQQAVYFCTGRQGRSGGAWVIWEAYESSGERRETEGA